jgi:hypothetical protein
MFIELCNTLFLLGILSSSCVVPDHHLDQGTVLNEYCDDTTLVTVTADGQGGELFTERPESEACGYVPSLPPAGTLLREGCSQEYPGVKWFQYADGEGGTYSEKDLRSYECGYRRYLNLSTEKEYGDRFDPVIVDVDYKDMLGRDEPWGMVHHSTTIGRAIRLDRDTVAIYGDGRTGDGIFTLGAQEIHFYIEPEPVCAVENRIDCVGYTQRSSQSYIYYGEDDDKIVTWELGIMLYASHAKYGDDLPISVLEEYDVDSYQWQRYEDMVEEYNEVYEYSGVHVRFKLTKVYLAHWHTTDNIKNISVGLPVDIVLGRNTSYPDTCGVAKVSTYFSEGKPPASMSRCDIYTDLHEMGHSVGLAHGPENQSWEASGYIFPNFGHGYNDICNRKDDLMSYGYEGVYHSNSNLDCDQIFPGNSYKGIPAGGKDFSDTAYTLNRVRYNVSLIHRENDFVDEDPRLQKMYSRSVRKEIEVVD